MLFSTTLAISLLNTNTKKSLFSALTSKSILKFIVFFIEDQAIKQIFLNQVTIIDMLPILCPKAITKAEFQSFNIGYASKFQFKSCDKRNMLLRIMSVCCCLFVSLTSPSLCTASTASSTPVGHVYKRLIAADCRLTKEFPEAAPSTNC